MGHDGQGTEVKLVLPLEAPTKAAHIAAPEALHEPSEVHDAQDKVHVAREESHPVLNMEAP